MAERRMFSKKVVNSARFLRMPQTARLLYYDLGMYADDDGIVEAFTVLQMTRADETDLELLASKGFVRILNEDLVAYICDWKVNNYIQKDRYRSSIYADLLKDSKLEPEWNPDGTQVDTACIQAGYRADTQDRLGKDSIDKDSIGKARGNAVYPFDPNEFDSIRKEFIERFSREPDKAFLPSISAQITAGKREQDVIEIIQQTAQRHPRKPEAYILAALKHQQEYTPEQDPNAPLADWEVDWLKELRWRQEQMRIQEQKQQEQQDQQSVEQSDTEGENNEVYNPRNLAEPE